MTKQEFDNTGFYFRMRVWYKGALWYVRDVDFELRHFSLVRTPDEQGTLRLAHCTEVKLEEQKEPL